MNRPFIEYFRDEMNYLRDAGKVFKSVYEDEGKYLNIDSLTDRDPYVERLFEGFAFLTGRIRERLDDELPEYTEGLFRLLHPHFIKPIPALSILAFKPRPGMVQETIVMPRGTEVRSKPVTLHRAAGTSKRTGEQATECRFTTAYPVHLQPIKLLEAKVEWPDDAPALARLRFQLDRGIDFKKLDLSRLRLYFHARPALASTMHLFFTRYAAHVVFKAGDETMQVREGVRQAGLAAAEGLLPYSRYSFTGYRLLHEYFSFRQKFWFVDILGLDRFAMPAGATEFEVLVYFDREYPEKSVFSANEIKLFCTPIVNLYDGDAEPIRIEHVRSEYLVLGDVRRRQTVSVYDIKQVVGLEDQTRQRHTYQPFYAFRHKEGRDRFYVETTRYGTTGDRETYISIENLGKPSSEAGNAPPGLQRKTYISLGGFGEDIGNAQAETLTLEVRLTNGNLPNELQEGDVNQRAPGFANIATFENLTKPTRELHPPTADRRQFFWQLLSHLALGHLSISGGEQGEALVALLRLYDWTGDQANRRRIDGIRNVTWEPKEMVHKRSIIRGAEVTIEVQDEHFADEGDLNLFGTVLSAFFTMYATINSFIHLTVVSMPSGKRFYWHPPKGSLSLV